MNSTAIDLMFTVPATIAALKLPLVDSIALSALHENQRMSNRYLANRLRLSLGGTKALLKRLQARGHLKSYKLQGTRHWHVPAARHNGQKVAENNKPENGHKMTPRQAAKEVLSIIDTADSMLRVGEEFSPRTLHRLYEKALEIAERRLPPGEIRTRLIPTLTKRHDAFLVLAYAAENLPRAQTMVAQHLVGEATPEQLAQLREQIHSNELSFQELKQIGNVHLPHQSTEDK